MKNLVLRMVLSVGLGASIVLAACGSPADRPFRTTLASPDGSYPLPVLLGDETGLVTRIEPAAFDSTARYDLDLAAQADPTDPRAFVVTWLGGACDNDAGLSYKPGPGGYLVRLEVHGKVGLGGCIALGIPRGVRIVTSSPIALDTITAAGRG